MSRIPPATPAGPVRLLLGDFNLTLDYRAMRAVLDTGYRDAAAVVGRGLATTWPYNGTPLPRVAIDHTSEKVTLNAVPAATSLAIMRFLRNYRKTYRRLQHKLA